MFRGNVLKRVILAVSLVTTMIVSNCSAVFAKDSRNAGCFDRSTVYTEACNMNLSGFRVDAENAEEFIRYGFNESIDTEAVCWRVTNIEIGDNINIGINNGVCNTVFSGKLYLGFDQSNGYNYVGTLDNEEYSTLYFCICEEMESKYLFSQDNMTGKGLIWYLYDSDGDLLVFERLLDNEIIASTFLEENVKEVAESENDTLWFVYKTEPIESGVIELEDTVQSYTGFSGSGTVQPCTSLNGSDTVYRGEPYKYSFYFTGILIDVYAQAYAELTTWGDTGNNSQATTWTTNLALYQRIYGDGEDITGSVSEVFKLSDITYKVGVVGNAVIAWHQPSGTVTTPSYIALSDFRSFAPQTLNNVWDLVSIFNSIMSTGNVEPVSYLNTLTCTAFGGKIKSDCYIEKDTELYQQYIGFQFGVKTYDINAARNTSATVRIQFEYTLSGGDIYSHVTDAVIDKSFTANK